jgi:polyribonucleotide nucleotidyltransferase
MKKQIERTVLLHGGKKLTLSSGKMAMQADGACLCRLGDTIVFASACFNRESKTTQDFLPLTVDYREYTYAGGRIPGGWFKREGRPTEKEILTCRLIDRPLRPLFPDGYKLDTQVIALVFSADGINDPDVLAINAASAAVALSPIPFEHPIGAVRVGRLKGEWIADPTMKERDEADLELMLAATAESVVMVEAGAREVSEADLIAAIAFGHAEIKKIIAGIQAMAAEAGEPKFELPVEEEFPAGYLEAMEAQHKAAVVERLLLPDKKARSLAWKAYKDEVIKAVPEEDEEGRRRAKHAIEAIEYKVVRSLILDEGRRLDGRRSTDIRPIACEVGVLPRTHGSALFTRGETQALVTCTLGTARDAQIIEDFEGESENKFMLHYNFPPFSTGEVKFMRGSSRREIGHGNLARRALAPLVPDADAFPYTVRLVSDILSSNGSSSMASICGGSLALMDAGVPIKKHVAGVAMGLMTEGDRYVVLTDIAGAEDHMGDMDFKVAGTADGVTALQMDIKVRGLSLEIMKAALEQARAARLSILSHLNACLPAPRPELSPFAPRLYTLYIPKDKIGDVIGTGGKIIRSIIEETGCTIEIEDDGKVVVGSTSGDAADRAIQLIRGYTAVPEVGKVYRGTVRRVETFGAFVEIMPNTDGLLHVSEFTVFRIGDIKQILKEGDQLDVLVSDIDPDTGKVRLSRKALIKGNPEKEAEDRAKYPEAGSPGPHRDRPEGGDRDRRGGPGRDRRPRR